MMPSPDTADLARLSSAIIQKGSKSFAAASKLFDPQTRVSAHLLYAWCRHCDDVIDGQELGYRTHASAMTHDPTAELAKLRQQTADALAGRPMDLPVFQAFQAVMARHDIPARHAFELLDGFAMDVDGRQYRTIEDTLEYCYHVAGVVGVMMAMIMGTRDETTLDRASDLGLGFQLTNIARDVVEDAHAGRVYLPETWLTHASLDHATLALPQNRTRLFGATRRLIDLAEGYYASSRIGMASLPLRSGWAIGTARAVYREIGREVKRRGPNAWDTRVSTSTRQKLTAAMIGGATAVDARTRGQLLKAQPRELLWTRPKG
jgi:15-cis-phytoene synthase